MKDFDIEKLDRKNIYKSPENIFDNVQKNVLNTIEKETKTPIYKLKWVYAVAASIVLIFGISFVYNNSNTDKVTVSENYSLAEVPKKDSQISYETLKQDILDLEESTVIAPKNDMHKKQVVYKSSRESIAKAEPVAKHTEKQFTEILDSFSNSEIAELASNSSQDVYLDIFN